MDPKLTGQAYSAIAHWWRDAHRLSDYGLSQLQRAIGFLPKSAEGLSAIDIGCGSSGRFIQVMLDAGFEVEGVDISAEMVRLAQEFHPAVRFTVADICEWQSAKRYDLISAWDSTFHLPIDRQEPVLTKLCAALKSEGVLIFTCGSMRGEVGGSFQGQNFEYSSLGAQAFVEILGQCGCRCMHLEHDQWPESHVCVIAQKAV